MGTAVLPTLIGCWEMKWGIGPWVSKTHGFSTWSSTHKVMGIQFATCRLLPKKKQRVFTGACKNFASWAVNSSFHQWLRVGESAGGNQANNVKVMDTLEGDGKCCNDWQLAYCWLTSSRIFNTASKCLTVKMLDHELLYEHKVMPTLAS